MPSVHKYPPVAYRPPLDVREPLHAFAEREGKGLSVIITEALREYLAKRSGEPATSEAESVES